MTKKHYIQLARAIREVREKSITRAAFYDRPLTNQQVLEDVTKAVADVCKQDNNRFNPAKFWEATQINGRK